MVCAGGAGELFSSANTGRAGARCGKFASKREAAGFEAAAKGICGSGAGRAGRTQEPRAPNPKVRAELPEKYGARQQEFMRALYTGIRADEAEQAAGVLARMLQNLEKMQTVEEGLE